jgi:hypothetical protein
VLTCYFPLLSRQHQRLPPELLLLPPGRHSRSYPLAFPHCFCEIRPPALKSRWRAHRREWEALTLLWHGTILVLISLVRWVVATHIALRSGLQMSSFSEHEWGLDGVDEHRPVAGSGMLGPPRGFGSGVWFCHECSLLLLSCLPFCRDLHVELGRLGDYSCAGWHPDFLNNSTSSPQTTRAPFFFFQLMSIYLCGDGRVQRSRGSHMGPLSGSSEGHAHGFHGCKPHVLPLPHFLVGLVVRASHLPQDSYVKCSRYFLKGDLDW